MTTYQCYNCGETFETKTAKKEHKKKYPNGSCKNLKGGLNMAKKRKAEEEDEEEEEDEFDEEEEEGEEEIAKEYKKKKANKKPEVDDKSDKWQIEHMPEIYRVRNPKTDTIIAQAYTLDELRLQLAIITAQNSTETAENTR